MVWPNLDFGFGWPMWSWGGWWPFAAVSATVLRLSLVLIISLLLTVVAPGWIRSMGVRASSALSSGLLGAVAEVLFVPALLAVVIGLTISIVGIPLLGAIPFALAIGALAWTGGFAAVAVCLGARLRGSSVATSSSLVADLLIGFVAITALTIIAHVISFGPGWMTPFGWMSRAAGFAVEYMAWTIGLGRGHLGPVRQVAGDAADARDVNVLEQMLRRAPGPSASGTRARRTRSPWAPSARALGGVSSR